ncbi:MAG: hypothetical protein K8W52_25615 [Deltaproteobacteria bacterium]|nr:hypothetical protein [Deltaproteobacteria bacterium]
MPHEGWSHVDGLVPAVLPVAITGAVRTPRAADLNGVVSSAIRRRYGAPNVIEVE